jgi:Tol biopolymer transport system component
MNKELFNQLSTDERQVAEKLSSAADTMKLSQSFQWDLETRLMDAYKSNAQENRFMKFMAPVGWAVIAILTVLLAGWLLRNLLPGIQPAAIPTVSPKVSFEENIRQGNICVGPLAVGHGFAVFLSNADKTWFLPLDQGKVIGEMRSFTWSADGSQLAIVGNTTGTGNVYLTDAAGSPVRPVLSNSELGYLVDGSWSRDGKQFVLWSSQNNKLIYLLNADGSGLVEKQLEMQILGTPQFAPDGKSIVFYGADTNAAGLFEMKLAGSEVTLLNRSVKDPSGYAFSPGGSLLAYMEYDRDIGEARLFTADRTTGERTLLGAMPIPRSSGASLPDSANLSWSADGKFLVFDFGQYASERVIYLAPADGTGLIRVVDSGYAPAISADGKCLAYISDKQVFLLDLIGISATPTKMTPLLLAELPAGRGNPYFKQDKLQWGR